ncbi:HNH endonuclease [Microvirga soli]|uniref:HNH endonuclease n=1 Tax=Microvirga soli TaxID=1854496 RepID=UPI00191F42E4|nr:HNH endonuclease [Microvirga soli]
MPFVEIVELATTARRKLTAHRRLRVWEQAAGVCALCERKIDGVRERWIVEHLRALELGGTDELANMAPAHEVCARAKTRDDHRRAAQAKRQKIRHIGAGGSKRPLPFGKTSPWKRTLSGRIVPRK